MLSGCTTYKKIVWPGKLMSEGKEEINQTKNIKSILV